MKQKELAGALLGLLHKGETDVMEMLCEAVDFCRLRALRDREENIPPSGYTKEEADIAISNGSLVVEMLRHLRQDNLQEAEVVLKKYAA